MPHPPTRIILAMVMAELMLPPVTRIPPLKNRPVRIVGALLGKGGRPETLPRRDTKSGNNLLSNVVFCWPYSKVNISSLLQNSFLLRTLYIVFHIYSKSRTLSKVK